MSGEKELKPPKPRAVACPGAPAQHWGGAPGTPGSRAGPRVPCAVGGGVGFRREVPALHAGCPGDVLGAGEQEDGEDARRTARPG